MSVQWTRLITHASSIRGFLTAAWQPPLIGCATRARQSPGPCSAWCWDSHFIVFEPGRWCRVRRYPWPTCQGASPVCTYAWSATLRPSLHQPQIPTMQQGLMRDRQRPPGLRRKLAAVSWLVRQFCLQGCSQQLVSFPWLHAWSRVAAVSACLDSSRVLLAGGSVVCAAAEADADRNADGVSAAQQPAPSDQAEAQQLSWQPQACLHHVCLQLCGLP